MANIKVTESEKRWMHNLRADGLSLRDIRDFIFEMYGNKYSHSTILFWLSPNYRMKSRVRNRSNQNKFTVDPLLQQKIEERNRMIEEYYLREWIKEA